MVTNQIGKMTSGLGIKSLYKNVQTMGVNHIQMIASNMLLSVLIARTLGVEGTGLYGIAIIIPFLIANIFSLGIAQSNVYHISSKKIDVSTAFDVSIKYWIMLTMFGLGVGYYLIKYWAHLWFPSVDKSLLFLSLWAFPFILFRQYVGSFFQALQNFNIYKKILLLPSILVLTASFILIFFLNKGVAGALWGLLIGQIGGSLYSLYRVIPILKSPKRTSHDYFKESIRFGIKSHLSNLLAFLNYRIDILFVNYFMNPFATGLYTMAVKLVEKLWIVSKVLTPVLLPKLSEWSNENEKRNQLTPLAVRWVFTFTFISSLILLILIKPIIIFLFGKDFLGAAEVIYYLLPGIVFFSASRIISHDLASRGKPELNMYTAIFLVVLNVLLNIALIPNFGAAGAAIATSLVYISNFSIKTILLSKLSKLSPVRLFTPNELDFLIVAKIVNLVRTKFKRRRR